MPRWEVCRIVEEHHQTRAPGFLSAGTSISRWEAHLFTSAGGSKVLAHTGGWSYPGEADLRPHQLTGLVAQLSLDGWEPMPLVIVGGGTYTSSDVEWYFKRQLPDA